METPARLTVDLGRLDGGTHARLRGELARALLELEDLEQIRPAGGLVYDLAGELLPEDEFLVRGSLALPCQCICARCGGDFDATFEVRDYCEAFPVAGLERLDLTESVRECIILALPSYPVCKEDCQGLCPHCGQNLNEAPCRCSAEEGANPFAALDRLAPLGSTRHQ